MDSAAQKIISCKARFDPHLAEDLLAQLEALCAKAIKKPYGDDYLVGQLFGAREIKNEVEWMGYCRAHVFLATKCLREFLRNKVEKERWADFLEYFSNLAFELDPFATTLGKKADPDFTFIFGKKWMHDPSFVLFHEAKRIFWAGVSSKPSFVEGRVSNLYSIFGLRQAMELRFRRALGLGRVRDKGGRERRLRHEFPIEFVRDNDDLIQTQISSIATIWKIYQWTNLVIHTGQQGFVWQIQFALDLCFSVFKPMDQPVYGHHSVYSSVVIHDWEVVKQRLREALEKHFGEADLDIEISDHPEAVYERKP